MTTTHSDLAEAAAQAVELLQARERNSRLQVEIAQARALLRRVLRDRPMSVGAYADEALARQIKAFLDGVE